jgi:transposase
MGSLVRRLRRLDAERKREEAEWERQEAELSREALRRLSDEDLYALEDILEAGQEDGTATFEDL